MAKIIYNKLVRDRIPEIIENSGKEMDIGVMNEEEYEIALIEKLFEEAKELALASPEERLKEMADIHEVLYALQVFWGIDDNTLTENRKSRVFERGAFHKRIMLHWVED